MISTMSPVFASLFSSCTMNFDVRFSALPYSPCRTCHSTATTMLFCILLLTTTPTFSDFAAMSGIPLLLQHRLHAREIAPHGAHLCRRLELAHRFLDAQTEQLIGQVALFDTKLVGPQVAQLGGL